MTEETVHSPPASRNTEHPIFQSPHHTLRFSLNSRSPTHSSSLDHLHSVRGLRTHSCLFKSLEGGDMTRRLPIKFSSQGIFTNELYGTTSSILTRNSRFKSGHRKFLKHSKNISVLNTKYLSSVIQNVGSGRIKLKFIF